MTRRKRLLAGGLTLLAALYLFNASWRVAPPEGFELELIAHRGVHQTYHREGLDATTCTAERIDPPTHRHLENTLPSMAAAFAAGASIVELDVHPTTDGHFAVFHDWTIDCRTEGHGVTREQTLVHLQSLDIGHGYTADGGKSFPFRGQGVGLMPELGQVLEAFPEGRFLVNFKSREAREGDMLAALLEAHPAWAPRVWGAYGGDEPTYRAAQRIGPHLKVWSRRGLMKCLGGYIGIGWAGVMPTACHNTVVMVPINVAPWLWGWPHLFQQRLHAVNSRVLLIGPVARGDTGTTGVDTLEMLDRIPAGFSGYVWTNRIELIGPAVRERRAP